MSIKKNTIANYIRQIYIMLIGILILPLYMHYLGPAAFGLVGFFAVMQTWLRLLDMGFTPALAREVAFIRGGSQNYFELKRLLRSLEIIFISLAAIVFLGVHFSAAWISIYWFKSHQLSPAVITRCISLMGLIFGIRWLNDLYVAGLCGLEKQVQYNTINIIITSLQYIGAWLLLKYFTMNVVYYFIFISGVALCNLLCNGIAFYRALPKTHSLGLAISFKSIKKVLPLALGSSYSSIVWVFVTQSDKLIFSHILPLAEYGYFSLLIIISSGVSQFSAPILQAILPRLTYYVSSHQREKMLDLYCKSTNLICILVFSVVGCVVLYAKPLLYAWSGSMAAANFGAPILVWYVLSSALLSVGGLQYSLQVAHGSLKLHAWYNTIAACIKIPLIVFIAFRYGVYATAITWFVFMVIGFFVWVPIVHQRYANNMHFRWLKNVLLISLTALIGFSIVKQVPFHFYGNRLDDFMKLFLVGLACLACLFLSAKVETKLKWID